MKLDTAAINRIGQAVQACYDPFFLDRPERAVFPSAHAVIWGTDKDGPRPYGVVYWDKALDAHICALRGTDSAAEWMADADASLTPCPFLPGTRAHRGFTTTYATLRIRGDLAAAAIKLGTAAAPDRRVIVSGHSLGAALATLLAADIGGVDLVTFASPAVGDDNFATKAATRLASNLRVVNHSDLVPRTPPRLEPVLPYAHIGPVLELSGAGIIADNPVAWHSMATYLHLLDPANPINPEYLANPS